MADQKLKAYMEVKTPNGLGTLIAITRPDDGKQKYMVAHSRGHSKNMALFVGRKGPCVHKFYDLDVVTAARQSV
jgi:hypothetical protein